MYTSATNSSLEVAYWFINRAKSDNIYLETDKLQHLLFIAQQRYAQQNDSAMLMPSLFSCDDKGFFEPTLRSFFSQGRPYMPVFQLDRSVSVFLEQIWNEFYSLSVADCRKVITNTSLYESFYQKGSVSVVPFDVMSKKDTYTPQTSVPFHKKILLSQNGPVVVSQWAPRKINI